MKKILFLCCCLIGSMFMTHAQYNIGGTTVALGGECFRLTTAANSQAGSVWFQNKISLGSDLTINATINLGTDDVNGADGIAFVLQPICNGIGGIGGGIGYLGINPSVAVEFDTWQNGLIGPPQNYNVNDPLDDHIGLNQNGNISHTGSVAGPITAFGQNVQLVNLENGANHPVLIEWIAATKNLRVTLDGTLRVNYFGDIVANTFGGNRNVFWGFTAATGAADNNQSVCIVNKSFTEEGSFTVTKPTCPNFNNGAINLNPAGGIGPFTYAWRNAANPSVIFATTQDVNGLTAGTYTVAVRDNNGCISNYTIVVANEIDASPPVITLTPFNGPLSALGSINSFDTSVPGSSSGGLKHGHGIAYDTQRNTVWVTDDELGDDVFEFPATQPNLSTVAPLTRFSPAVSSAIEGIAFDPTDNTLWIVDETGHVLHYDRAGTQLAGGFNVAIGSTYGIAIQDNFIWVGNPTTAFKFNKIGGAYAGVSFNTVNVGLAYDTERHLLWSSIWPDGKFRAFNPANGTVAFVSNVMPPAVQQGHDVSIGAGKLWLVSEELARDRIYSIEIIGGAIDQIIECHSTYTDPGYTTTDNCPNPTTVVTGSVDPNTIGNYTLTYTATDASGNVSTVTRTITVLDRLAPVPSLSSLPTATGECSVTLTAPTATDACMGTVTGTTGSPITYTAQGTYSVTWTYSDGNGNSSSQVQSVVVKDITPPTIACPANITQGNDAGICGAVVTYATPVGTDNCSGATTTQIAGLASGSEFPVGTTTNTFEVTDAVGLKSTCSFTVTINDNEAPTISCPGNITTANDAGNCGAVVNYNVTATDNCTNCSAPLSIPGYTLYGSFNGHTYFRSNNAVLWPAANTAANATGGHLATISSAAENAFLSNNVLTWIGLSDVATPGSFQWVTGEPLSFTSWFAGEPNNAGGNEIFVEINRFALGKWNDLPNGFPRQFYVEFDCLAITQTGGLPSGSEFPVGTTTNTFEVTDAAGNKATCSFDVIVTDTEKPVVSCPANITQGNDAGVCGANVSFAATATDNCPGTAITYSQNSGTYFPVGTTTVTATATDAAGNSSTCSFTVTVKDTEKPVVSCPANITQGNDAGVCGANVSFEATATDNCPGTVITYSQNSGTYFPVGTTTVTATATDAAGNSSTCSFDVKVTNAAPTITTVTGTVAPVPLGTATSITVTYVDNNVLNAALNWDDGTPTQNVANPANTFTTTHTYASPGVYSVFVTLTDACGLTATYEYQYLVVYDPSGGFVTGGGWINSPAGAYRADPSSTGKANFGFVAKYKKGSNIPDGNTEFQYHAGGLNFKSSSYDAGRLVIAGFTANFKGVGTINGAGNYGFLVAGIDGQITGGGGIDKFRMKIWDINNGHAVVYDNNLGLDENGLPTTALGGGSIVIHNPNKARLAADDRTENEVDGLSVKISSNPSSSYFVLQVQSDLAGPVSLRIHNAIGMEMEKMEDLPLNTSINIGEGLKNGAYFAEVMQAGKRKVIKLLKVN